jgi:environmental stress-induced protein Ves
MQIIRKEDIQTSNWSGGTTSELFIFPTNSIYKDLNFGFRLSRATIEVEESVFTPLPNVKRQLMLLDGELELTHEGHHTKKLKPLQFDTFSGDWNTKSKGKATDFNLMTLGNTKGTLSVMKAKKKQFHAYKINNEFTVFYINEGTLQFEDKHVNAGELIVFNGESEDDFKFNLMPGTNVVVVRVSF